VTLPPLKVYVVTVEIATFARTAIDAEAGVLAQLR
jgi:hypothetical protein